MQESNTCLHAATMHSLQCSSGIGFPLVLLPQLQSLVLLDIQMSSPNTFPLK